jgi:hypothetical protein
MLPQGELEHRRVKRFYRRTNKAKFVTQVAKHERREALLRTIETRVQKYYTSKSPREDPPDISPKTHHLISQDTADWYDVRRWTRENKGDVAVKVFDFGLRLFLVLIMQIGFFAKAQESSAIYPLRDSRQGVLERGMCFGEDNQRPDLSPQSH